MRIAPGRRLQVFQLILSYTISNIIKLLPPLATAGIISVVTRASNFNAIWFYVILFILFTILYYSEFLELLSGNWAGSLLLFHHSASSV